MFATRFAELAGGRFAQPSKEFRGILNFAFACDAKPGRSSVHVTFGAFSDLDVDTVCHDSTLHVYLLPVGHSNRFHPRRVEAGMLRTWATDNYFGHG